MTLFVKDEFTSHAGVLLPWKIECDSLTGEDISTLCWIVAQHETFREVIGVPKGGIRIADELRQYASSDSKIVLIVDDVLTTGTSMEEARELIESRPERSHVYVRGVVLFARRQCPHWITPIFQLMY